jgi:hypothetical protein
MIVMNRYEYEGEVMNLKHPWPVCIELAERYELETRAMSDFNVINPY